MRNSVGDETLLKAGVAAGKPSLPWLFSLEKKRMMSQRDVGEQVRRLVCVPPNEESWMSEASVNELPTTVSSGSCAREIVIGLEPAFPESVVCTEKGEEPVC
jgi:hypothetical protein